ncbi:S-adenosylmethionine decarboxylase proenzyme [Ricinus communis]|uniref:S-adenosylmethionine decarboxylase proenzyme n=1 Tax=Ricinus communis TaxID=3988 RepID=UPI00201A63D3|nr:S-adenosylmethionine decarboxylase proenzyme [Ricinus communis]
MAIDSPPPSPIGFEGFEKRLEITFQEPPIFKDPTGRGLRALSRSQLDSILEPACCTIVSQLSNTQFDSYVLSESSLFVYPFKIVLKTCGTTKLLLSIKPILSLADSLSVAVTHVQYSRGTFIFPNYQPAPHRSFSEEVTTLNEFFSHLNPLAYVIGDWHIYSASQSEPLMRGNRTDMATVEICMTGLEKKKAAVFFKSSGNTASEMTKISGIRDIIPSHVICDFDFDPCGYSMNGIDGSGYSTVHVTPEDGFSYASYEALGLDYGEIKLNPLIKRVLKCFGPKQFSVAVTCRGGGAEWWAVECSDVDGYTCKNAVKQELQNGACVVYTSYEMKEGHVRMVTQCWKEVTEVDEEAVNDGGGRGSLVVCL